MVGDNLRAMAGKTRSVHLTQQDFIRLRKLIAQYGGLDESALTDIALERAIAQRLAARHLQLVSDYWPLLRGGRSSQEELDSLAQLLTNKETFFFREIHQFEALRDIILPEIAAAHTSPLKLWSAGCSTGEEPYSLAITLLEYQDRHGHLDAQIIATDIDMTALEKARRGCYGERAVRLVPDELRRRYFSSEDQTFCIIPEVGRLVTFRQHNLAAEESDPKLSNMDIIFCRNVTIYLSETARDRLNARLAHSLREGGYLFVASAETMGHDRDRLELISTGKTFLFRKTRPSAERATPPLPALPGDRSDITSAPAERSAISAHLPSHTIVPATEPAIEYTSPGAILPRVMKAFQRQDYADALHELDQIPEDQIFWPEAHCLRAAILLQQERLVEAEASCQQLLAHDPWHANAHFLMGLVFRQQGQVGEAIQSLRQAIYLHPSHRDAHFYLAEIYRALGLTDQALREYRNTLNILTHRPEDSSTTHLSGLTDDILRQACEANLSKLEGQQNQTPSGGSKA
jgi:chemotaxis protein methyltransferase CheR